MAQPVNRVTVDNHVKWGKLVKSWSTGKNYFDPDAEAPKLPTTIQELKDQCLAAGVNIAVPATVKDLLVYQYKTTEVMIRLPPAEYLQNSERLLASRDARYTIPDFYSDFFETPPETTDELMNFHAARIGEYTINSCM